jgi:ABC-type sugar transport system ATPase subunit
LLRLQGISKRFGSVAALDGVDFELAAGEVHALVGANGAGKSTLIQVLAGAVAPDRGEIRLRGVGVRFDTPRRAQEHGIAVLHQHDALFGELSVAENLFLGADGAFIDWRRRRARARELLASVGPSARGLDPNAPVQELSAAQRKLVEIARALAQARSVLVLDEPTAVLSSREAANLLEMLRALRGRGLGVAIVTHRLAEVEASADRVSVLRDGRMAWSGPLGACARRELIGHMLGGPRVGDSSAPAPEPDASGEIVLRAADFGVRSQGLESLSFELRVGEILVLTGLVGSGRSELAGCLFGLTPLGGAASQGVLELAGRRYAPSSASAALRAGLALVPEDRQRDGIVAELSLRENVGLPNLERFARRGRMDSARERRAAEDLVRDLGVKTPSVEAPLSTLSGGNQQKVALGRFLAAPLRVLILDEPTQGVDVAGRAEIHGRLRQLARNGLALLVISSDADEVEALGDRIAVMRAGRIVATFRRGEVARERWVELASGMEPSTP